MTLFYVVEFLIIALNCISLGFSLAIFRHFQRERQKLRTGPQHTR